MISLRGARALNRARRLAGILKKPDGQTKSASASRCRYYLRATSRALRFERDYPAFLIALSSAIKSGQDPLAAMCSLRDQMPKNSQILIELESFAQALYSGASEESAILGFAAHIQHPDIDLFRTTFLLARRHGGSLGDALRRLVQVTRQRQSFRRKIGTAVAMQRFSALGIAVCAVLILILQLIMVPRIFTETLASPLGIRAYACGLTLIASGVAWMLALSKRSV